MAEAHTEHRVTFLAFYRMYSRAILMSDRSANVGCENGCLLVWFERVLRHGISSVIEMSMDVE
jgi:hypothetical protein